MTEITAKPNLAAATDEAMALYLVQDLLDCLNLNYTSSVFKVESGLKAIRSRSEISEALKICMATDEEESKPDDSTMSHSSDTGEPSIIGQKLINMEVKRKPLLMEVLRTLANHQTSSPRKSETSSNADDYNDHTFITTSAQNTTANQQTSESL